MKPASSSEENQNGTPAASDAHIFANIDVYTEGDDAYKRELVALVIENLKETCMSASEAIEKDNVRMLEKLAHKAKVTLHLLKDDNLTNAMDGLLTAEAQHRATALQTFIGVCNHLIVSLNKILS